MLVFSPHFDDAVLALGSTMADRAPGEPLVVCTVMGGWPRAYLPISMRVHDAACGFVDGDDVVARRREEDAKAVEALGGEQAWLGFVDSGYREGPWTHAEIRAEMIEIVEKYDAGDVYVPLGLGHPDHVDVRAAGHRLATHLYVEPGYRDVFWYDVDAETRLLGDDWVETTHLVDPAVKLPLIRHYRSQIRGLAAIAFVDALSGPETVWRKAV